MNNIILKVKNQIKRIPLIKPLFNFLYAVVIERIQLINLGFYTTIRTLKYSLLKNNKEAWKASMRVSCHILEKGLTMPGKRLGFGQARVVFLANEILSKKECSDLLEIEIAIGIIKEYDKLHKQRSYKLPRKLQYIIDKIVQLYPYIKNLKQINISREEFFSAKENSFLKFSTSRRSVRHFSRKASEQQVNDSIELALTAPSACNRQAFKCHIFNDKIKVQEVLSCQSGNRGFGHLVPQVCVLTVDLRMIGKNEQNDIYFNAGLFAMNLCYSFHYNEVGSCMLNWSVNPKKDKLMRKIANISNAHSIAVVIAFGIPSKQIEIARSDKKILDDSIIFH